MNKLRTAELDLKATMFRLCGGKLMISSMGAARPNESSVRRFLLVFLDVINNMLNPDMLVFLIHGYLNVNLIKHMFGKRLIEKETIDMYHTYMDTTVCQNRFQHQ